MKPKQNRIILKALRGLVKNTNGKSKDYKDICKLINIFKCNVKSDQQKREREKSMGLINDILNEPPFKGYWEVNFVRPSDDS